MFFSTQERRLRAAWRLALQFVWMAALLGVFGLPLGLLARFKPAFSPQATLFVSTIIAFLAITVSVFIAGVIWTCALL
jgi:hypothetical protein